MWVVIEFTAGGGHSASRMACAPAIDCWYRPRHAATAETNDWGASMSVGHVRHRRCRRRGGQRLYVNLPLSLSLRDDQLTAHANIGWLREGASGADRATWGWRPRPSCTRGSGW